ncbi:DUF2087 domain-containing protein [bacterium]|nr:DUF2087 domain-containing protein [candidate division CSSED10-310 bacterium]
MDMDHVTKFRISNETLKELETGIRETEGTFVCVVCGSLFERGVVFSVDGRLLEASRAAVEHIRTEHGGMLTVLLGLPSTVSGLSDVQQRIISGMGAGCSDRDIARELGGKAESTIRNHRFQFRRRLMEAKIMVAIGSLLERNEMDGQEFISFHKSMPIHDERTMTTRVEAEKVLKKYFRQNGHLVLIRFPRKEKEKLVILKRVVEEFDLECRYTEKEVNEILKPICEDYVTVRRYLIEYRFLGRKADGSEYWVNE